VTRSALLLAIVASLGLASCVISPQPSPPLALDGDQIGLTEGIESVTTSIGFHGGPGSVDPAEGVVVVTNLDESSSPSTAPVNADGSFDIAVPGQNGQTFRFQAKNGSTRSTPFDLTVQITGGVTEDTSYRDCLVVKPSDWIDFDGTGDKQSVVVTNACDTSVTYLPPRLRRGRAGFAFSPTKQFTLEPGESSTVTVVAGTGTEIEDVLILQATGDLADERWITLTLPDPK
jgi:hypothetical protein